MERETMLEPLVKGKVTTITDRVHSDLDELLESPIGFYLKAHNFMRLLTPTNVDEIMGRVPRAWMHEFLAFAEQVYLRPGERLSISGTPLPEESFTAIRAWVHSYYHPRCPECKGDLGGISVGRIEHHKSGCPRFPL